MSKTPQTTRSRWSSTIRKAVKQTSLIGLMFITLAASLAGWTWVPAQGPLLVAAFVILGVGLAVAALNYATVADGIDTAQHFMLPAAAATLACLIYSAVQKAGIPGETMEPVWLVSWLKSIFDLARFSEAYKEPFYTATSTLVAIVIALALVKGIEDVQRLQLMTTEEAAKIKALHGYISYFDKQSPVPEFCQQLNDYIKCINTDIRHERLNDKVTGDACVENMRDELRKLKAIDDNDKAVLPILLQNFEDFVSHRARRRSTAKPQAPRSFVWMLGLMAGLMVLPFLAEPLCLSATELDAQFPDVAITEWTSCGTGGDLYFNPGRFSQYFMIAVLSGLFTFALVLLDDLRDPYSGAWRVEARDFKVRSGNDQRAADQQRNPGSDGITARPLSRRPD